MAELTSDLASTLYLACMQNAEEASGAFGRAFDGEYVLRPQEPGPFSAVQADDYAGPGLAIAFRFGDEAMLALLPAGEGMVPEWVKEPDVTGESKLSTLAQELSMLLVPDNLMADAFEAQWAEDLSAIATAAQIAEDASAAQFELAKGESLARLTLIWPAAKADEALKAASPPATTDETPAEAVGETPSTVSEPANGKSRVLRWAGPPPRDFQDLPPNVRSFLQVGVVVSADLAAKKMRLSDVVELGPGSIITFEKPCDEPLDMCVGGHPVARGEAVKVGERFGVRVQEMILPDEHFRPMLPPKAG